jgi:hypothetical protein
LKVCFPLRYDFLIASADKRLEILNWLSPERFNDTYDAIKSRHLEGSGTWFLQSQEFQNWATGISNMLVVTGMGICSLNIYVNIDIKPALGSPF